MVDELLAMVIDAGLMLASDGNASNLEYRAGYQTALLNLLMLANVPAEKREALTQKPVLITFNEPKAH